MNYDINEFLPIQQGKCQKNAWEEIEKKIGITSYFLNKSLDVVIMLLTLNSFIF